MAIDELTTNPAIKVNESLNFDSIKKSNEPQKLKFNDESD